MTSPWPTDGPTARDELDALSTAVLAELIDSIPGVSEEPPGRLASIGSAARARGMGALCYGDPELLSDADYEVAATDLAWREHLPWGHRSTIGALRALMKSYFRRTGSFWSDAAAVQVPTLVIWGTRDRLVDVRLAERTAAAFGQSSLLVIRGVGHTA